MTYSRSWINRQLPASPLDMLAWRSPSRRPRSVILELTSRFSRILGGDTSSLPRLRIRWGSEDALFGTTIDLPGHLKCSFAASAVSCELFCEQDDITTPTAMVAPHVTVNAAVSYGFVPRSKYSYTSPIHESDLNDTVQDVPNFATEVSMMRAQNTSVAGGPADPALPPGYLFVNRHALGSVAMPYRGQTFKANDLVRAPQRIMPALGGTGLGPPNIGSYWVYRNYGVANDDPYRVIFWVEI